MRIKIALTVSFLLLLAFYVKNSGITTELPQQDQCADAKASLPANMTKDAKKRLPASRKDFNGDSKTPESTLKCCDQNQPATNLPSCDGLPSGKPEIYFNLPGADECRPSHTDSLCRKAPHVEKAKTIVIV